MEICKLEKKMGNASQKEYVQTNHASENNKLVRKKKQRKKWKEKNIGSLEILWSLYTKILDEAKKKKTKQKKPWSG